MNRHLAIVPEDDDESGFGEFLADPAGQSPGLLAQTQARDARRFMEQVRASKGIRFPWADLNAIVGPLLPGWLVAVGGRAKAGKTTMLLELLTAWTELGKTVVYIGTETQVAVLRYTWAAVRCNVPIDEAIDPDCPRPVYDRLMADVEQAQTDRRLAEHAIFADAPAATVSSLAKWIQYGKGYGADAVIFDHLSRLEVGSGERWQHLGDAIRQIKQMAVQANCTVVVGAQLTQGQGGSVLGEHEVPGNGSWAGSSEVQREVDVGIQLWRPFKPGVTTHQKQEAREDMAKARELVQPGVMGVRLAAHRWGKEANTFCKLYVERGQITGWSPR